MKNLGKRAFLTRAVHAGERAPLGKHTPVATPIHPSVGYFYESMNELDAVFDARQEGYVYLRYGSPTIAAFEAAVAELEEGESAQAVSAFGAARAVFVELEHDVVAQRDAPAVVRDVEDYRNKGAHSAQVLAQARDADV